MEIMSDVHHMLEWSISGAFHFSARINNQILDSVQPSLCCNFKEKSDNLTGAALFCK